jgi:creatinine amidohydrolase/Fe(II)-dependent formamide hydrolase-like protein
MEKKAGSGTASSAGTLIRNITIGVVTPVLAAAVIYFLDFDKDKKADFTKKKVATEKTWAAYIQNKNIFSAVMKKLGGSDDIEATRNSINHEIDVTITNMENIKKETDADQRVYSTIDIVTQQMKELKPVMNQFLDDMVAYTATNPTEEEGQAFVAQQAQVFRAKVSNLRDRDSLRLNAFYEGLNKEYEITLPRE